MIKIDTVKRKIQNARYTKENENPQVKSHKNQVRSRSFYKKRREAILFLCEKNENIGLLVMLDWWIGLAFTIHWLQVGFIVLPVARVSNTSQGCIRPPALITLLNPLMAKLEDAASESTSSFRTSNPFASEGLRQR